MVWVVRARQRLLHASAARPIFGCEPGGHSALQHLFRKVVRDAEESDARGRAALERAVARKHTGIYNRLLKHASDHRNISLVEEAISCMRRDGVVQNAWTVAVQINAFARVGRLEEARQVLSEAEDAGIAAINNATIEPLVKAILEPRFHGEGGGATAQECVVEALELVDERLGPGTEPPSFRTVNTLLRGCKRWAPQLGPRVLQHFEQYGEPHLSSLALAADICCMGLDAPGAAALLDDMERRGAPAEPRRLLELATVHALRGEASEASVILRAVATAIDASEVVNSAPSDPSAPSGRGRGARSASTAPSSDGVQRRGVPLGWLRAQYDLVARFVADGGPEQPVGDAEDSALHSALVSWSGADRCVSDAAERQLHRLVAGAPRVCVEVGAGAGEWLVEQAAQATHAAQAAQSTGADQSTGGARAATPPPACWVAIEPQLDRVHQLWCRTRMHRLQNVHICASDAASVLGTRLPPSSVDVLYVRHPFPVALELRDLEATAPPEQAGLISGRFLSDVVRVLRPGGTFELLTNEPVLCALVLATIRAHPAGSRLRARHGAPGFVRTLATPRSGGGGGGGGPPPHRHHRAERSPRRAPSDAQDT